MSDYPSSPIVILLAGCIIISFNMLALLSLTKCKYMCRQLKCLALNMVITDLVIGFTCIFIFGARMVPGLENTCHPKVVIQLSIAIVGLVSIFTVTLMAVDRFLSVYLAEKYILIVKTKHIKIVCFITWVFSISINISAFLKSIQNCQHIPFLTLDGRIVIVFALLSLVILFCYIGLLYFVIVQRKKTNSYSQASKEKFWLLKPFLKLSTIVLVFVCSYLPYMICLALKMTVPNNDMTKFYVYSLFVALMNSLINPILYVWRFKECRMQMMLVLCCCRKKKVHEIRLALITSYAPFLEPLPVFAPEKNHVSHICF